MEEALDDVEFLALSENRVDVLRLLAERRHTRGELAAATGASQATLGRILSDFEDRAWVERIDGGYVATATGTLVATGITDLLSILDTERNLRPIVDHLPTEAMDFDLRHLADARITTPTQTRPNAPVKRLLMLLRDADEARVVSLAFNEQSLTAVQERTAAGDLSFWGVFSRSAIEALADDSILRERLLELLSTDGVEIRICDAEVPLAVTLVDDTVYMLVRDDNGVLQAGIETDAAAVRDWASETFERYWEAAPPLCRDDFSE